MEFKEFGLADGIMEAIEYMGFEKATEIQELAIPLIMQKMDTQLRLLRMDHVDRNMSLKQAQLSLQKKVVSRLC